jgi:hypothetical protein
MHMKKEISVLSGHGQDSFLTRYRDTVTGHGSWSQQVPVPLRLCLVVTTVTILTASIQVECDNVRINMAPCAFPAESQDLSLAHPGPSLRLPGVPGPLIVHH